MVDKNIIRQLGKKFPEIIGVYLIGSGTKGERRRDSDDYTELDYRLAYSDLKDKLRDLEKFAKSIHQFMESLEKK